MRPFTSSCTSKIIESCEIDHAELHQYIRTGEPYDRMKYGVNGDCPYTSEYIRLVTTNTFYILSSQINVVNYRIES